MSALKKRILSAAVLAAAGGAVVIGFAPGGATNSASAAEAIPPYVAAVVADRGRAQWDVMRDDQMKPAEILAFSQIKSGMVVADFIPGNVYYTRMLAKLVGPTGKVYAVVPGGGGGGSRSSRIAQREGIPPAFVPKDDVMGCVLGCYQSGRAPYVLPVDYALAIENIDEYNKNVHTYWESGTDFALPEQVDAVFTAGGYHELHYQNLPKLPVNLAGRGGGNPRPLDTAALNKSIFGALKNGGVYIVVDYAAAKGNGFKDADKLHRTEADAVKAEILAAGFVLDGESKVLARANDNHTASAEDTFAKRDRLDQFVFRFKKPMNAPNTNKRPTPAQEAEIMKNWYGNTFVFNIDLKNVTKEGQRLRTAYYNSDHSYQEFGRIGEGPGPMQAGTWFWDADGHNCMLHQFPIDERSNVVCHVDVFARPLGVVQEHSPGNKAKVMIDKGYILKGYILPQSSADAPGAGQD